MYKTKRRLTTRQLLWFSIILIALSIHSLNAFTRAEPLPWTFFMFSFACLLLLVAISIESQRFIWPILKMLKEQACLLSTAQILLFGACSLYTSMISIGDRHILPILKDTLAQSTALPQIGHSLQTLALPICLSLFGLGLVMLIPGTVRQRHKTPQNAVKKGLKGSLVAIILGFLFIPGFLILISFASSIGHIWIWSR